MKLPLGCLKKILTYSNQVMSCGMEVLPFITFLFALTKLTPYKATRGGFHKPIYALRQPLMLWAILLSL